MKTAIEDPDDDNYPPAAIAALMRGNAQQVLRRIPYTGPILPPEVADAALQVLGEMTVHHLGVGRWLWGPRALPTAYGDWTISGIYEPTGAVNVPADLSTLPSDHPISD